MARLTVEAPPRKRLIRISRIHRLVVVLTGCAALLAILSASIIEASPVSILARAGFAAKVVLLIAPLALLRRSGDWLHPLIFYGVWRFIFSALPEGPIVVFGLTSHPALSDLSTSVIMGTIEKKYLMDCLALVSMYLGFYFSRKMPAIKAGHGSPQAVSFKLAIVMLISLSAFLVLVNAAGGLSALALQRGIARGERVYATIGGGHWHLVTAMAGPAVLMAAALLRRPLRSPVFLTSLALALAFKFIVTGSRGGTLAIVVLLFLILSVRRGGIPTGKAFALVLIVLVAIGLMTQFRGESRRIESVADFEIEGKAEDLMMTAIGVFARYAAVNNEFAIYARVPESSPLQLGKTYLTPLVAPVPRAMWAEKPRGVGTYATETFIPHIAHAYGIPATGVSEAFWNFHVVGVAFVYFVWGCFLRFIWKSVSRRRFPGLVVLYVITIYYLEPYSDSVFKWLHFFVPAVIVLVVFSLPPLFRRTSSRFLELLPARQPTRRGAERSHQGAAPVSSRPNP
jgi:oligosaccharide repeat unit polymerase